MPYLGDFLGAMHREFALSRTQADVEAVRMAEMYAKDPYLKYFPVPRFRLPTLTVRVPVAVEGLDSVPSTALGGVIDGTKIEALFARTLDEQLAELKNSLPAETRRSVDQVVADRLTELINDGETVLGEQAIAQELAQVAVSAVSPTTISGRLGVEPDVFRDGLRRRLAAALPIIRLPAPRLRVLVTDTQLKEASANVIQIDLTLTEDAVEWTVVDNLEDPTRRLVPE